MEFIEVLTEGLEKVLMVRGGGREVITIYSWSSSNARIQQLSSTQLNIRVSANLHKNCCCCLTSTLKNKPWMHYSFIVRVLLEYFFYRLFGYVLCLCSTFFSTTLDQLELLRRQKSFTSVGLEENFKDDLEL